MQGKRLTRVCSYALGLQVAPQVDGGTVKDKLGKDGLGTGLKDLAG